MQTTYPFSKERRFQSQQTQKNESNCCPITLSFCLPCGALERREFQESHSRKLRFSFYWTRESQYDIGVGSTNETKNFFVFIIRNLVVLVRVSGPTPLQWWEQPQHSGVNMNKSSLNLIKNYFL